MLCAALSAFLLADAVFRAGWAQALLLAPWVLLGLWIVYEIAFVSFVRVDGQGAVVQNMLRRTSFGWLRVRDVDLQWQLVFALDDGTDIACYGGPVRARPGRRPADADEPGRAPTGLHVLAEVRNRWQTPSADSDAPIRRSWDVRALVALGIIAAGAVVSVMVANS